MRVSRGHALAYDVLRMMPSYADAHPDLPRYK